jgi:hypothetical protein
MFFRYTVYSIIVLRQWRYLSCVEIVDIAAVHGDKQKHEENEKEDDGPLVTVLPPHQPRAEGTQRDRNQRAATTDLRIRCCCNIGIRSAWGSFGSG